MSELSGTVGMVAKPSEPSICIPRAFHNISPEKVKKTLEEVLNSSCVDRIDCIERADKSGKKYKRFFIHLKFWPKDQQSLTVREKLLQGETIKIVYQEPWYWKCSASRIPKPSRKPYRKGPYVLEEENVQEKQAKKGSGGQAKEEQDS
jgi:hypothetical protein